MRKKVPNLRILSSGRHCQETMSIKIILRFNHHPESSALIIHIIDAISTSLVTAKPTAAWAWPTRAWRSTTRPSTASRGPLRSNPTTRATGPTSSLPKIDSYRPNLLSAQAQVDWNPNCEQNTCVTKCLNFSWIKIIYLQNLGHRQLFQPLACLIVIEVATYNHWCICLCFVPTQSVHKLLLSWPANIGVSALQGHNKDLIWLKEPRPSRGTS